MDTFSQPVSPCWYLDHTAQGKAWQEMGAEKGGEGEQSTYFSVNPNLNDPVGTQV